MKRGPEIFRFADELWGLLLNEHIFEQMSLKKQLNLLQRNLDLLRSLPAYSEQLMATSNDFAFLPNEIIVDVVSFAAEHREEVNSELKFLLQTEGLWSDFGRKVIEKVESSWRVTFTGTEFFGGLGVNYADSNQPLPLEEAMKHPICTTLLDKTVDWHALRTVASNLYENIEFTDVPNVPDDILNQLGDRFSEVKWVVTQYEETAKNYMKPEVVDFLKRQLQSKYLTNLRIAARGLQQGELDNLLVDFVTRPLVKSLEIFESSSSSGSRSYEGYHLPFIVIKEACEKWNSTENFVVHSKTINGIISEETRLQLLEYCLIPSCTTRLLVNKKHATVNWAQMTLAAWRVNDRLQARLQLISFSR